MPIEQSGVATPNFDRVVGRRLGDAELAAAREKYAVHETFGNPILELTEQLGSASEAFSLWWKKEKARRDGLES